MNLSPGPDAYPQNNCLNTELRDEMLSEEIITYDPDIACLQVSTLVLNEALVIASTT